MPPNATPRVQNKDSPSVAAVPAPGGNFTFLRASNKQCEGDKQYPIGADSAEEQHFMKYACEALREAGHICQEHAQHPVIQAFADQASPGNIDILYIKFCQLRFKKDVPSDLPLHFTSSTYRPAGYECCVAQSGKEYVVNPEGNRYEVLKSQSWPYTFELVAQIDLGLIWTRNKELEETERQISYAFRMTCCGLPSVQAYLELPAKKHVIKIECGELLQGSFANWPDQPQGPAHIFVHGINGKLVDKLAKAANWNLTPSGTPSQAGSESWRPQEELPSTASSKYQMDNIGDELCYYSKVKGSEGEWKRICSFAITEIVAIYEHLEGPRNPVYRLKVHKILDAGNSDVLHISPEMNYGIDDAQGCGRIEAEVLVSLFELINDKALHKVFADVSSYLVCEELTLNMLKAWLNHLQPWPKITKVVSYFGRQRNSNTFVMGNCAFKDGELFSHDEIGCALLRDTFTTGKMVLQPWPQDQWPRIMLIEQPWIRYTILHKLWTDAMPKQFLNNVIPAKAAFALAVLHLQCSKFWDGEASVKGLPSGWLKSTAPNTGKSEVQELINSMLGMAQRGIMQGCVSSAPAITSRLTMQADMSLMIDEMATKDRLKDVDTNTMCKDLAHSTYDHTVRGKLATASSMGETKPRTSWIGSSNILVNESDSAFMQRILLILFQPLDTTGVDPSLSGETKDDWERYKKLSSCLMPDLETLLVDHKLDREALNDCCTFMNRATGEVYARNANLWGFLLYYMLLLEFLASGETEAAEAILEWICTKVVQQNYIAQRYNSEMQRFILALHNCRTACASNPLTTEEKSIHHHNLRTMIQPPGYSQLTTVQYVAVRVESACHVIKTVLKLEFKPDEIRRSAEDHSDYVCYAKGAFYDLAQNPWPICVKQMDQVTLQESTYPLPEAELLATSCKMERALFIKQDYYDKVVNDVENVASNAPDYKLIDIKSAEKRFGQYNFFDAVTVTGWYGYRALECCSLKCYAARNRIVSFTEPVPGLEEANSANGFPKVWECYSSLELMKIFSENGRPLVCFPDIELLPPALRINPYQFRNDDGDITMPDDTRSLEFHLMLQEEDANLGDEFAELIMPSPPQPDRSGSILSDLSPNNTWGQRKKRRIDSDDEEVNTLI